MPVSFRTLVLCVLLALVCEVSLAPPALAEFPCEADEVRAATIPPRSGWAEGEPTRDLTKADRGWVKMALGLDWRLMRTDEFAFVAVPAARTTPLFFIQRWDSEWCGSGGCTMTLYDCAVEEGEDGKCEALWSSWKEAVHFPGTGEAEHPDFIAGGTDLFTWADGGYRAVCNVTVLAE